MIRIKLGKSHALEILHLFLHTSQRNQIVIYLKIDPAIVHNRRETRLIELQAKDGHLKAIGIVQAGLVRSKIGKRNRELNRRLAGGEMEEPEILFQLRCESFVGIV